LEAYLGAHAESYQDLEAALVASKELAQTDSCRALEYLKGTEVGKGLTTAWDTRVPSPSTFDGTNTSIESEIDWSNVSEIPRDYIDTDLYILDGYIETVKSCNAKFPAGASARIVVAQDHLARVGYVSLFEKVKADKAAAGQETEFQLSRMMAFDGEDTGNWSETMCDDYASATPYERMYIKRYRER
jgi:hypothetical protein